MDKWKETAKNAIKYCREERQEEYLKEIERIKEDMDPDLEQVYLDHKRSMLKTIEITIALEEEKSWDDIRELLMEGKKWCEYPIGLIIHYMLRFSKFGIEFAEQFDDGFYFVFTELKEEYEEEKRLRDNKETLN